MPSSVGTTSEAWRYPIKSLGGVRVGTVELDQRGVRADRALVVYGADGRIGSGKSTRRFRRMDGLLECTVRLGSSGAVAIVAPTSGRATPRPPEAVVGFHGPDLESTR